MLGFNFYQHSPRYIPPRIAREIIGKLPPQILTIGVFVNAGPPAKVKEILTTAGVNGVQFHGDETPAYCREFRDRFVIKALRVTPEFEPARADDYEVSAIMLDAFDSKVRGGTGHSFDWSIALEVRDRASRLFLAGGLSSQNVRAAITTVQPYAIDVCSSLETVPGKKDSARVWNFIKVVRNLF
jgi:phosphoribosylanthranilate isomerase